MFLQHQISENPWTSFIKRTPELLQVPIIRDGLSGPPEGPLEGVWRGKKEDSDIEVPSKVTKFTQGAVASSGTASVNQWLIQRSKSNPED